MALDIAAIKKVFNTRVFTHAMQTFDKSMMVVVLSCWGSALFLMMFALYTLNLSVDAKRQVVEAAAMEPSVPSIVMRPIEQKDLDPVIDRIEKQFPEISVNVSADRSVIVTAAEGSRFRSWLALLSYIETISPQFRWRVSEFCVGGKCPGSVPMKATLMAEKVTFSSQGAK